MDRLSWLPRWIERKPRLSRLDAGPCDGCDVELAVTAILPRFGARQWRHCTDPASADIVVITGAARASAKREVMALCHDPADPKVLVAIGVCPVTGGIFRDHQVLPGDDALSADEALSADVTVLGCPPRPQAIAEAMDQALALWRARRRGL